MFFKIQIIRLLLIKFLFSASNQLFIFTIFSFFNSTIQLFILMAFEKVVLFLLKIIKYCYYDIKHILFKNKIIKILHQNFITSNMSDLKWRMDRASPIFNLKIGEFSRNFDPITETISLFLDE